ncbi:MAG TPA: thiamine pyrophosphate-dependent dehydrogenase E1 component subunit alpha [Chloroflexota bacterium]
MLVARKLSDRMLALNRQGRVPFAVTAQGHEACQVASAFALRPEHDWVATYYRDLGVVLALGMTSREVMLHFFSRDLDPCSGGRQMPNHWSYPRLRIITGSSVVATQIPHAVGLALASKLRGEDDVTVAYFGEGGSSEGDFHEGLNFASIHQLPVIFFCENNGYAITEPQSRQMAIENVADRGSAYGIAGQVVDGNDPLAVYQTMTWAVSACRHGHGPKLIEAKTYRLVPHTSSDDDRRYRSRAEVEEWAKKDPVIRFRDRLLQQEIVTEARIDLLDSRAEAEVDDAVEFAEKRPLPSPEDAFTHVYAVSQAASSGKARSRHSAPARRSGTGRFRADKHAA